MLMFKRTHELLMEIEALKRGHLEADLAQAKEQRDRVLHSAFELEQIVASQQSTIAKLTAELLLIRGFIPKREEKPEEHPLAFFNNPDITVAEESENGTRRKADEESVEAARRALEAILADPIPTVTPEALAAATPTSLEDWKKEHSE
jgi:hypothetical protein